MKFPFALVVIALITLTFSSCGQEKRKVTTKKSKVDAQVRALSGADSDTTGTIIEFTPVETSPNVCLWRYDLSTIANHKITKAKIIFATRKEKGSTNSKGKWHLPRQDVILYDINRGMIPGSLQAEGREHEGTYYNSKGKERKKMIWTQTGGIFGNTTSTNKDAELWKPRYYLGTKNTPDGMALTMEKPETSEVTMVDKLFFGEDDDKPWEFNYTEKTVSAIDMHCGSSGINAFIEKEYSKPSLFIELFAQQPAASTTWKMGTGAIAIDVTANVAEAMASDQSISLLMHKAVQTRLGPKLTVTEAGLDAIFSAKESIKYVNNAPLLVITLASPKG